MAIERIEFKVKEAQAGMRLDHLLFDVLPGIMGSELSRGKVRKLIMAGAVHCNRARVRIASKEMRAGTKVEVYLDLERLGPWSDLDQAQKKLLPADICFEDEWLVVVNKPYGVPTQPTLDQARVHLFGMVKEFLASREGGHPERQYVGLHHRLDRDTSGLILFTKKKEANAGVARLFKEREIEKTYIAFCEAMTDEKPKSQDWITINYLASFSPKGAAKKGKKMHSVRSGGDLAETHFKILDAHHPFYLIQASPKTGRMHQIRVHLGEAHIPVFGDRLYGWDATRTLSHENPKRFYLHAAKLTFKHPVTGKLIEIVSEIPFQTKFE